MAQPLQPTQTKTAPAPNQVSGNSPWPQEIAELLTRVAGLLREGQPGQALQAIARARTGSPWVTNAIGVCQLRLGNARVAVDVFRGLVLAGGGLLLRRDVPPVFKINYATALLLADNLEGCQNVLAEVAEGEHPAVQSLRTAIRRWKAALTLWEKVRWYLGGQVNRPVTLDGPPGDLG
jgi:hypothetical protein